MQINNSLAIQLQAMQLDYARESIAQAQASQPGVAGNEPAAIAQQSADVILELSASAQQFLSAPPS